MWTFPNSVLLRGEHTIIVDPGLPLMQNEPILGALAARGLTAADVDQVVLTHAHLDHAGGCADLLLPVTVHERETATPHWALVAGLLELLPLQRLQGPEGELVPGVEWALTPGHCKGHISLKVDTADGPVVLCGDTIGPTRAEFDGMQAFPEPGADELLASWRRVRDWPAGTHYRRTSAALRAVTTRGGTGCCARLDSLLTISRSFSRAHLRVSL